MMPFRVATTALIALLSTGTAGYGMPGDPDIGFGDGGRSGPVVGRIQDLAPTAEGELVEAGFDSATNAVVVARRLSDGALDPTFGTGSVVTTVLPGASGAPGVRAVLPLADGRLVVVAADVGPAERVLRYLSDGTLDPSFGTGGIAGVTFPASFFNVTSVAVRPNGKIVLGGDAEGFALAQLLPDGSPDTGFAASGFFFVSGLGVRALVAQPDGKILASGDAAPGETLARFEDDGSLDASFGGDGLASNGTFPPARLLVLQPDGRPVQGGGTSEFRLARFNSDGTLDATFGAGGVTAPLGFPAGVPTLSPLSASLALQPDGKLLVGGGIVRRSLAELAGIARFLPNGALDPSFGQGGVAATSGGPRLGEEGFSRLVVQSDGRIVGVAAFGNFFGPFLERFLGGTCGNGVLEAGEDCDDGNTTPGDGCGASCCTADTDGDGRCDAIDPCASGVPTTKARLRLKVAQHSFGRLQLRGDFPLPAVPVPPVDLVTNGVRLMIADALGVRLHVPVPPGVFSPTTRTGWRTHATSWTWTGDAGSLQLTAPGRIYSVMVRLKSGPGGTKLASFSARGTSPYQSMGLFDDLPLTFTVGLDAGGAAIGQCGIATFPGPPPLPSCVLMGSTGDTVTCK